MKALDNRFYVKFMQVDIRTGGFGVWCFQTPPGFIPLFVNQGY